MDYRKHLKNARHGHMPGITKLLMETGMCADYEAVADLTMRLFKRVQGHRRAVVTSEHGTDFEVVFHPEWKWLPDTGMFHKKGDWGNLPAGEVYTAPLFLHGRLVTHLLGDYFSEKFGKLTPPVAFDVADSRVVLDSITGPAQVVKEFKAYLTSDPWGTRAGEFAMGTNTALTDVVGNLLQDEKIPGVHVAFGHPYSDETGAPWTAKTHVDCVLLHTDVTLDGAPIQKRGTYVF
ncbi:MAG: aminopeptidase [Thermoplasmatota archaeon]